MMIETTTNLKSSDKPIKAGVLIPAFNESSGGGYTYVQAIRSAIEQSEFSEQYSFISYEQMLMEPLSVDHDKTDTGCAIRTPSDILNYHLKMQEFEVLWILFPLGGAVYPSVPFAITVWDIAHRYFPYLPEIANGGWDAKSRDEYYAAMLAQASLILTGNERGKLELQQNYCFPIERVFVAPLPAPRLRNLTNLEMRKKKEAKRIFYPAQFWAHKNHYHVIAAMKVLIDVYEMPFELILTGADHGNREYIERVVEKFGLERFVKFLGLVSRDEIESLYVTSDLLLYLSLFGPDNLPPLEAFAAGCPVIASDHPGHREQLGNGAIFVDPLSPELIARNVFEVLSNEELRNALVGSGKAIALAQTPAEYVKRIHEQLRRIAKLRMLWAR